MSSPELWIVAGPNGAGKTTCVKKGPISILLPDVSFFNPDDRTLEKLQASGYRGFIDAPLDLQTNFFFISADEVFQELKDEIAQNRAVGVETVLSSEKYRSLVDEVVQKEGFVGLIYIALSSPKIAVQRVAERVQRGGHGIPNEKIEKRWVRSLTNLSLFASLCTAFWVFDNSDSTPDVDPILIATGKAGLLEFSHESMFPEMKSALLPLPRK